MIEVQPLLLTQFFTMPHLHGIPVCHIREHTKHKNPSQMKQKQQPNKQTTHKRKANTSF